MCGLYTEFDHKSLVILFNGPKDERYTNSNFRKKTHKFLKKKKEKKLHLPLVTVRCCFYESQPEADSGFVERGA